MENQPELAPISNLQWNYYSAPTSPTPPAVNLAYNQPLTENPKQSYNQPFTERAKQSYNELVTESTEQTYNQSVTENTKQSYNKPINQDIKQSYNEPDSEIVNLSSKRPFAETYNPCPTKNHSDQKMTKSLDNYPSLPNVQNAVNKFWSTASFPSSRTENFNKQDATQTSDNMTAQTQLFPSQPNESQEDNTSMKNTAEIYPIWSYTTLNHEVPKSYTHLANVKDDTLEKQRETNIHRLKMNSYTESATNAAENERNDNATDDCASRLNFQSPYMVPGVVDPVGLYSPSKYSSRSVDDMIRSQQYQPYNAMSPWPYSWLGSVNYDTLPLPLVSPHKPLGTGLKKETETTATRSTAPLRSIKPRERHRTDSGESLSNKRKPRTSFTAKQKEILTTYFNRRQYPDALEKEELSEKTGLPFGIITVWFKNRRAILRKRQMKEDTLKTPAGPGNPNIRKGSGILYDKILHMKHTRSISSGSVELQRPSEETYEDAAKTEHEFDKPIGPPSPSIPDSTTTNELQRSNPPPNVQLVSTASNLKRFAPDDDATSNQDCLSKNRYQNKRLCPDIITADPHNDCAEANDTSPSGTVPYDHLSSYCQPPLPALGQSTFLEKQAGCMETNTGDCYSYPQFYQHQMALYGYWNHVTASMNSSSETQGHHQTHTAGFKKAKDL
ncbi:unnamed protein product [Owenia fusiformis]|uniref:Homeobox domain-containing protein n=1 Tax=Owenia fusiformis TaxID=6347 RepID=A0A8S4NS25_OWEFU|nr:unnamed protein product [Owenia fusiformis]